MATTPTTLTVPTADFVTTTLNGAISNSATTLTIGTGLTIPAANGYLHLSYDSAIAAGSADSFETVLYAAYNSGTGAVTGVTRGAANTTAVSHSNNATVQVAPTVLLFNNMADIIGNSAWTTFSSTITGFSGTPTQTIKYIQLGKLVFIDVTISGTSNATGFTFTLPVAAKRAQTYYQGRQQDNGAFLAAPVLVTLGAGSATCTLNTSAGGGTWTNVNGKSVDTQFFYEAN